MSERNATSSSYPQFSDPHTARLLTLYNHLLKRPARVVPRLSERLSANPDAEAAAPAHPTYDEIMAIVNKRHPCG